MSTTARMALDQIGQKLKSARESQGLSLADIYQRTKIPINHLQSIDTGNTDELPEPVYVSGFIRRYAECVGLNGQALSDEYKSQVDSNGNGAGRAHRAIAGEPVIIAAPSSRAVKIDQSGPSVFKTMGVSVFWIVVILGLITFLFWWNSNNNSAQDTAPILSLRDQPNRFNNVAPSQTPAATDKSQAPDANTPSDSRISLTASQHVWAEVKSVSSGDSLFTGYLEAGDRRDFQDGQGLRVRAGNGGSLTVEFMGKSETFGQNGKVAERVFMAKTAGGQDVAVQPDKPAAATAAPPKPIVKKVTQKPAAADSANTRRFRRLENSSSSTYIPGESLGAGRSSVAPLRYTEGRLDSD